MTDAAWTMLACTWAVVFFFTFRFFWKVVRTPPRNEGNEGNEE